MWKMRVSFPWSIYIIQVLSKARPFFQVEKLFHSIPDSYSLLASNHIICSMMIKPQTGINCEIQNSFFPRFCLFATFVHTWPLLCPEIIRLHLLLMSFISSATPKTKDVNWTYIRRSIYVLCLRGSRCFPEHFAKQHCIDDLWTIACVNITFAKFLIQIEKKANFLQWIFKVLVITVFAGMFPKICLGKCNRLVKSFSSICWVNIDKTSSG